MRPALNTCFARYIVSIPHRSSFTSLPLYLTFNLGLNFSRDSDPGFQCWQPDARYLASESGATLTKPSRRLVLYALPTRSSAANNM